MLDRLAGNTALKEQLGTALRAGRLPHAILLVGESGCGTGFAARCLAADYLYPSGGPHAEAVLKGEESECLSLRGEGASGNIKVDDVRTARNDIQKSALSTDAAGRVLFVYGAQNLNTSSGNSLLKLIEEPPEGLVFLFTTTSAATVLPTIRSRCAAYTVTPASPEICAAFLQSKRAVQDRAAAEELAFLYEGHIGTCLKVAGDAGAKAMLATAKEILALAAKEDTYLVLARMTKYEKDKPSLTALLWQLEQLCSAVLRRPAYGQTIGNLSAAQAAGILRALAETHRALKANANTRLTVALLAGALTKIQ